MYFLFFLTSVLQAISATHLKDFGTFLEGGEIHNAICEKICVDGLHY
jgi:hypothetical protein